MLNDFQLQALNDYIKEPIDMNLEMFTMSINPSFKLTKKSTTLVKSFITKMDGSDTRIKALINYINPIAIDSLVKTAQRPTANDNKRYLKVDKAADKERKTSIYTSLFGDWSIKGTLAYSLINPDQITRRWTFNDNEMLDSRNFGNKTLMQPEIVIRWTEEITGKRIINFYDIYMNRVFMPGNLSSYVFVYNGLSDFREIDNKGHDGNSQQFSGYNSVSSNVQMGQVFQSLEGLRQKMQ